MDKMLCMMVFGVLAVASMMQDATAQTVNGAAAYTNWAAGKTFSVGDTLVFNFTTGRHDVQQVEKTSFDGCNSQNAIGNAIMTGPANMTLNSTGEHYYICTFGMHCLNGQKLAITVSSSNATPGANPPNPSNPTTPVVRQPEACAPTPSAAGPSNSVPGGRAPPPTPSSSTTVLASFVLSLSTIALATLL
ncbi:hypothetical protein R3W88_009916 [Solanum pinnatisectum]|uniref:Phytocyanin domain-containing protein n=1 Tax=Solanum pinnatisectum TaxID=50273 RepID=A0AAV9MC87_9SOLN|nr:hypothetical protein R3W88_009916 [Solanum pinnatisectum]